MIITKIEKQKNNSSRYNVFIDSTFAFSAALEDIYKYSLKEGLALSDNEDFNKLKLACEYSKAYTYTLDLLSIKSYSSNEIKRKLTAKSFSLDTITKVIDHLTECSLLNDEDYAANYAKDCLLIKKYGKQKIKNKLCSKGFDKSIIEDITFDSQVEYDNCLDLAKKKMNLLKDKPNYKEKLYRFLLSKGYEYDVIKSVFNFLFQE